MGNQWKETGHTKNRRNYWKLIGNFPHHSSRRHNPSRRLAPLEIDCSLTDRGVIKIYDLIDRTARMHMWWQSRTNVCAHRRAAFGLISVIGRERERQRYGLLV